MKPYAVLGSGPAGLMAAQAVALAGQPLALFSSGGKSALGGAQFLHRPIPAVNDQEPDTIITYRVLGDEDTYRRKVYPDQGVPFTSFGNVKDGEEQQAWNLGATYERLWDKFHPHLNELDVTPQWIGEAIEKQWFAAILSTVPLPAICRVRCGMEAGYHRFDTQNIWVSTAEFAPVDPDTIVYNGEVSPSWYRASHLFGVHGTEWVHRPPLHDLIQDRKPIMTNCDCWGDEVVRLGRRGTWKKGVLTHDAFVGALKVFMD